MRSITSSASSPARLRAAISSEAWFWAARRLSTSGSSSRRRASSSSSSSSVRARAAALERGPRRARVLADRAQVEHARPVPYSPSAAACCSSDWISLVPPGFGGRSTSLPE